LKISVFLYTDLTFSYDYIKIKYYRKSQSIILATRGSWNLNTENIEKEVNQCYEKEYFSKSSYFDGAVIVEYNTRAKGISAYLTFRFYEKGTYEVSFSITPDKRGRHRDKIPQNFTKTIEVAPREIVIKQYILPDFLRVTIVKDGESESHDFS